MRFRDWVTALAGFAAVAVAIFAVGGVLRWTQAVVALLVAIAFAFTISSRRALARLSPLVALLGIAAGLTAIQLVPLPSAVVELFTQTTAALREDGTQLMEVEASSTLTADVPATLGALVFFLTLLGLALVALRMSTSERGRYRVIASVAALCGVTAFIVAVHKIFGMTSLYGIYEPYYARPIMLGPLLNSNSLACLMAVGAMLAIGLAAQRRQPGWLRVIWIAVVAGCGAITVATVSRGATIALVAGSLVTIGALLGQRLIGHDTTRRRRIRFATNALPIAVVAGCMVLLVIWVNAGNVGRQLSHMSVDELSQSRSKFAAWRSAATLVEETPWVGVGRGAFEPVFTRVHPASGVATYGFLENEYVQAIVDWGVPGALALGFAMIWLAIVAIKRWRDGPIVAGALGALAVVAIQSNVDFGLQFLGLAAPVTAIAATLAYVPLREVAHVRAVQGARAVLVLALVGGALLLFSDCTTTIDEDRRALRERPSLAAARAAIERHPLDYYNYAVAAEVLEQRRNAWGIRVLNHALVLHPTHPDLHRMAARMLYRQGSVTQSAIEYSAAMRSVSNPRQLLAEILARLPREQAAAALPVDYLERDLLIKTITELGRADVAALWLERVLKLDPRDSHACERLVTLAQQGVESAAEIAGERCAEQLHDYQTRLVLAQMLARKQSHEEVIKVLADIEGWQSRVDDKIAAWLLVCDAHRALDHIDEAKRCLRRLDASPDMRMERRNEIIKRLEELNKPTETGSAATGSAAPGSAATGSAATGSAATGSAAPP